MNKLLLKGLCGLVLLSGLGSCIREQLVDCPPLQVVLTVKDKNYFNIDDAVKLGFLERKAENLPFREYVGSLYYIVYDAEGHVVAEQKNTVIGNDDQTQRLVMSSSLPYGTYTVTVWGNMQSDEPLGEDATSVEMEAVGAASHDIYLASATLDYRFGKEIHTLGMERTKGNLLIKAEGIPDNIDFSTKQIEDVYGLVDYSFRYSRMTSVHTELEWEVHNEILTQTLVGPSASYEGSTLQVAFIEQDALSGGGAGREMPSLLEPEDVHCTFGRNELTILKYVYDESDEDFSILVYVNDEWEEIHEMEVE